MNAKIIKPHRDSGQIFGRHLPAGCPSAPVHERAATRANSARLFRLLHVIRFARSARSLPLVRPFNQLTGGEPPNEGRERVSREARLYRAQWTPPACPSPCLLWQIEWMLTLAGKTPRCHTAAYVTLDPYVGANNDRTTYFGHRSLLLPHTSGTRPLASTCWRAHLNRETDRERGRHARSAGDGASGDCDGGPHLPWKILPLLRLPLRPPRVAPNHALYVALKLHSRHSSAPSGRAQGSFASS